MEKYNVSLIGINLTENENVFLGAILKINSLRSVVMIVKQSDQFTEQVNSIIDILKKDMNMAKEANEFNAFINKSKMKFMMYNVKLNLQHTDPTPEQLVEFMKQTYFKVFTKFDTYVLSGKEVTELNKEEAVA